MLVSQSCPTLCDPMDCIPLGSSVCGILQARVPEWVAISYSRGSSRPRDWIRVSRTAGRFFAVWAPREAHSDKPTQNLFSVHWIPQTQGFFECIWPACDSLEQKLLTPDQLPRMLLVYFPPFSLPIWVRKFCCTDYYETSSTRSLLGNKEFDTCFRSCDDWSLPLKS